MIAGLRSPVLHWTGALPVLAVVLLALTWGRSLPVALIVLVSCFLAGAVLAAVHHAEVIAHRVGEPFGSLVLAVAVTIIEVALIVTLTADGGEKSAALARDTVFAAVMITCNGIVEDGHLALEASHMVLLALTVAVGTLTVIPGRATPLQGGVHLALLAAYIVPAVSP